MLSRIRLELARTKDYPAGSRDIGYEFTAPLNAKGRIDHERWLKFKDRCRVRRFRLNEDEEVGHLIRKPGGAWAFHYDVHGDPDDDETGYKLGDHAFKAGEYVSIREDEELRTYRVRAVTGVDDDTN